MAFIDAFYVMVASLPLQPAPPTMLVKDEGAVVESLAPHALEVRRAGATGAPPSEVTASKHQKRRIKKAAAKEVQKVVAAAAAASQSKQRKIKEAEKLVKKY